MSSFRPTAVAPSVPADCLSPPSPPPEPTARRLLQTLRAVSSRTEAAGAALYRFEGPRVPAEIMVGIGSGLPLQLSPGSLKTAPGGVFEEGRIAAVAAGPRPVVLFCAGDGNSPPLPIPADLLRSLAEAWQLEAGGGEEKESAPTRPPGFAEFIGTSPNLLRTLQLIEKVAPTGVSVLVLGESGTGKELVGRAVHRHSRRTGRFVSENCAALSDSLLEGELFGTEKGAYTGASRARAGLIEEAHHGTLFLDEIGEMGTELQSKLLRVLQEREVRRLGGIDPRPVDFRVVCATHRDLDDQVERGRFRADLLFRLDVVRIELPPLRERKEDIPLLVEHFLEEIAKGQGVPPPEVDPDALAVLQAATWPGNLRELRNELERACALTREVVTPDDLSPRVRHDPLSHTLTRQVREQLGNDLGRLEKVLFGGVILQVLQEAGGNKAEAARRLGIPKTNLYRRLDRYGIPLHGALPHR